MSRINNFFERFAVLDYLESWIRNNNVFHVNRLHYEDDSCFAFLDLKFSLFVAIRLTQ